MSDNPDSGTPRGQTSNGPGPVPGPLAGTSPVLWVPVTGLTLGDQTAAGIVTGLTASKSGKTITITTISHATGDQITQRRAATSRCAVFPPAPGTGYTAIRLTGQLLKLPPATLVVQAKDPEGNGFSLVADVDAPCAYRQGQWGGEITEGTGAVCLWPLE
jgi:hypothetical protein